MKSFSLFLALAVISAAFGFRLLSGIPAIVFQIISGLLFIMAGLALFRRRRIQKPVQSSFASSFRSDVPAPTPSTPPARSNP
jgi:uncharacterized membrane protein YfcA